MPNSLPPEAQRRLGLILARLMSDHDGEVVNAARLAVRILREHNMRPEDLAALLPKGSSAPPPPPPRDPPPCTEDDEIIDAALFAEELLRTVPDIRERERAFLNDLIEKEWRRPTEKQAAWLFSIAKRARRSA